MTYKELKKLCKDGKREKREYLRGIYTEVNLLKMEIVKDLPIQERKKLMEEEWKDYLSRNKHRNFYIDNLTYRLKEEYNLKEV